MGKIERKIEKRTPASRVLLGAAALAAALVVGCAEEAAPPPSSGELVTTATQPLTCVNIARGLAGAVADATIQTDPTDPSKAVASFGAGLALDVGTLGTATKQTLLRFDLSPVPAGAFISSANLNLRKASGAGTSLVDVHRVTSSWTEGSVTWAAFGGAFDSAVLASFVPSTVPAGGTITIDLKPTVQAWVNGVVANDGILLDQTGSSRVTFGSSEGSGVSTRPVLQVCYAPASCGDGIQNGQETGVDCGGACSPCNACANVVCAALDACHVAGVCNPATGLCSNPPAPALTLCDDNNACTQTDMCVNGVCTGSNPVTCTASDVCHGAGTCDPASGVCSNPAVADGTLCDDGNACTQSDTCQSGTCTGANPVVCAASDPCHAPGTCDPASGVCSNPSAANGTACNDGNACTQSDTCQSGTCTGANPVVCAPSDPCHAAGTCDPATGSCSNPAVADGTGCNDGNACTQTDTCQAGSCSGSNPVVCAASDQCHSAGTCNSANGTCSNPAVADGTSCNDGNAGTSNDVCTAGTCAGTSSCSCPAGFATVAGGCQKTYSITQASLFNLPNNCDGTGTNWYSDCTGNPYGFTWADDPSSPAAPSSVQIQYIDGISCNTGGVTNPTLNGVSAGTHTFFGTCSCTSGSSVQTITTSAGYNLHGTNTFSIPSSTCNGLSQTGALGGGVFAVVTVTYPLSCAGGGAFSCTATPSYIGNVLSMDTRSHGGGYSPAANEYWYPEWSGNTIYRYNSANQFVGAFQNPGNSQIMQLWGDADGSYFTANWGYQTIQKITGMNGSVAWTYNMPTTTSGVTTDANYVYAMNYYDSTVIVLDKSNGSYVTQWNLSGGTITTMYGAIAVAGGKFYRGNYNGVVDVYDLASHSLLGTFNTADYIYNMAFTGSNYCISANTSSVYCYALCSGSAGSGAQSCTGAPAYSGSLSMDTRSHGGGFSPAANEYWYPEWAGNTVYRYNLANQFLGTFQSPGNGQIMQIWGEADGSYYTANWGYSTIQKITSINGSVAWTYNTPWIASGVTSDSTYVYAMNYYDNTVIVLDKSNGSYVTQWNLSGGTITTMYGAIAVAGGKFYRGNYHGVVDVYDLATHSWQASFNTADSIYNMSFTGSNYCISANSSSVYCYAICTGAAGGGGGSASTYSFTDTGNDDVTSSSLYTFFQGLGSVSASSYIYFEVNTNGGGGAWCSDNADFYVSSYLSLASGGGTANSGGWGKYYRSINGAWSGADYGVYGNYYGASCDGNAYSWCSEWGLGGYNNGAMPGQASLGESYSNGWSNGGGWVTTIKVAASRAAACGF